MQLSLLSGRQRFAAEMDAAQLALFCPCGRRAGGVEKVWTLPTLLLPVVPFLALLRRPA